MPRAPVVCITHGGGPMPVLEPQMGGHGHDALNESLRTRVREILRLGTSQAPRAIVVITPHWRPDYPTITMVDKPPLFHDFEPGHPPAAWDIQYDAPGSSEVANLVYNAFAEADLSPGKDFERGFDHGVFIPFIFISPSGEVPLISVSISSSSDPELYTRMGRALIKLREDNIAVVGSGFASYHNVPMMRKLYSADPASAEMTEWRNKVADFNSVLKGIVAVEDHEERAKRLRKWRELPFAYDVHPDNEDEHILPLIVCSGAADNSKGEAFADPFGGVEVYTFYWSEQ